MKMNSVIKSTIFIGFCLLLVSLFPNSALGQEKAVEDTASTFYLSGQVFNTEDSAVIPGAHILRFSDSKGVVSDDEGRFRISLNREDSAMISIVGYERFVVKIPDSLSKRVYHARIYMLPKTYNLPTVTIKGKGVRATMDLELPELDGEQIQAEERYKEGNSGFVVEGPITSIYNAFSKEKEEEAHLKQLKINERNRQYIANSPYLIYIREELGIGDDEVKRFLAYCDFEKDYKGANYYEIIAKLEECYRYYRIEQK